MHIPSHFMVDGWNQVECTYQPHHSITSWDDLCNKFFARYILPSKTALMRSEITMFHQEEDGPLFEAWEIFTSILLKCPHHGIADWLHVEIFYNVLTKESWSLIDAASGGAIWNKEVERTSTINRRDGP
ncbi:unnamed protein product [Linum trigynum]|uniref:Retrotransposon gag domain-containing protein n=1 Tax=Linum trigynum TaxID=586398 RepID=A0AAV2E7E8_9ROSI